MLCLSTNLVPDLQNKQRGAQSRAVVALHLPELREGKVVLGAAGEQHPREGSPPPGEKCPVIPNSVCTPVLALKPHSPSKTETLFLEKMQLSEHFGVMIRILDLCWDSLSILSVMKKRFGRAYLLLTIPLGPQQPHTHSCNCIQEGAVHTLVCFHSMLSAWMAQKWLGQTSKYPRWTHLKNSTIFEEMEILNPRFAASCLQAPWASSRAGLPFGQAEEHSLR